jgi:hypothetical protein
MDWMNARGVGDDDNGWRKDDGKSNANGSPGGCVTNSLECLGAVEVRFGRQRR